MPILKELKERENKGSFSEIKNIKKVKVYLLTVSLPAVQEAQVRFLCWEDPLETGNPLQYSYLENSMDRGAWWAAVYRAAKNWTRLKRLSMQAQ